MARRDYDSAERVKIQITLSGDAANSLDSLAARAGLSRSAYISMIITQISKKEMEEYTAKYII